MLGISEKTMLFYSKYIAFSIVILGALYVILRESIFVPLIILPPIIILTAVSYIRRNATLGHEEGFGSFLNDLKDLLQGGMPLVSALELTAKNNYGKFNRYVTKLAAQVKLGTSFEKALKNVMAEIDSSVINKTIYVISETHKRGGNLIKVFIATSKYVTEVERLKLERKNRTYSSLFTSYLMFIIFLGIILGIQAFFLPLMSSTTAFQTNVQTPIDFNQFFLYLIIVQALFSGPLIGKISEDSLVAGLRHSVILLAISLPTYIIISAMFIPPV